MHALQTPTCVPYVHTNSDDMVTGLLALLPARQLAISALSFFLKLACCMVCPQLGRVMDHAGEQLGGDECAVRAEP